MTLNDLSGQKSLNQNDHKNIQVKCSKFEIFIFISFEVTKKQCDGVSESVSDKVSYKEVSFLKTVVCFEEISDLVKFVMCTKVSSNCVHFSRYIKRHVYSGNQGTQDKLKQIRNFNIYHDSHLPLKCPILGLKAESSGTYI